MIYSTSKVISIFLLLIIKDDILNNVGNQIVVYPHWLKKIQWKSMGPKNCLVIQNIVICVQQKTEIHTGLVHFDSE